MAEPLSVLQKNAERAIKHLDGTREKFAEQSAAEAVEQPHYAPATEPPRAIESRIYQRSEIDEAMIDVFLTEYHRLPPGRLAIRTAITAVFDHANSRVIANTPKQQSLTPIWDEQLGTHNGEAPETQKRKLLQSSKSIHGGNIFHQRRMPF